MKIKGLVRNLVAGTMLLTSIGFLDGCGSQDMRDAFWKDPFHETIFGFIPNDLQPGGFKDAQERERLREAYERGRRDAIGNQSDSDGYVPIYENGKIMLKKCNSVGCTYFNEKGDEVKYTPYFIPKE